VGLPFFGDSGAGSPFFVCWSLAGKSGIGRGVPGVTGTKVVYEWCRATTAKCDVVIRRDDSNLCWLIGAA